MHIIPVIRNAQLMFVKNVSAACQVCFELQTADCMYGLLRPRLFAIQVISLFARGVTNPCAL